MKKCHAGNALCGLWFHNAAKEPTVRKFVRDPPSFYQAKAERQPGSYAAITFHVRQRLLCDDHASS